MKKKGSRGKGRLTEDFEHSGGISNPGAASGDLAVVGELIGRLNRGDGQGGVPSDGDASGQRGALVALHSAVLGAERHALPDSCLLLQDGRRKSKRT